MLYNASELIRLVKARIGIQDVPLPVSDQELLEYFDLSTLRQFSIRHPHLTEAWVTEGDAVDLRQRSIAGCVEYVIPKKYYQGTIILDVKHLMPGGYGSEANMYMPNVVLGSADMLIESVADIKMAASLGAMMTHAPTRRFEPPDKLFIYNGWTSGSYRIELALKHDLSLSTVPDTSISDLLQLAELDLSYYLYNKLRRKTNIDTGIGNIDLKIDNWEGNGREFWELLKQWDDTVEFDASEINYW